MCAIPPYPKGIGVPCAFSMSIQQFMCPRIRLTKTDGSRAIIPIDAISGIEEDKRDKCVRINTMDGFSYDVPAGIYEIGLGIIIAGVAVFVSIVA